MKLMLAKTILLVTAWATILHVQAQPIILKTSDTLLGVSRQWAEAYQVKHPEAKIEATSGTTAAAFSELAARKVHIITVPRGIRYQETEACQSAFGKPPDDCRVGVSAAAVYVHTNNPVTILTYDELYGIFQGKYTNWKEVGGLDAPIAAYGQSTNTPAGELFVEEVLNGKAPAINVRILTDNDLRQAIDQNANGIGFGAFSAGAGLRALSIKRVFSSTPAIPSQETISNRIYPITRFLFSYLDPATNQGQTKAYLDWIRSDEGQQVARQAGFYPLAPKWRTRP
jgi:phosphate transport system substrate-binding protein